MCYVIVVLNVLISCELDTITCSFKGFLTHALVKAMTNLHKLYAFQWDYMI